MPLDDYSWRRKVSFLTGFSPVVLLKTLTGFPAFLHDLRRYQRMNELPAFHVNARDLFPILTDRTSSAGVAEGHYFNQDIWAARKIFLRKPTEHVDIGSRIDGFVSHVLVFMPITVVDIRPLKSDTSGLVFLQDDATELQRIASNSVESLSSLHAAEHFGLGRYSDPIDPLACFKFMNSLQRVLAPDGRLYFSVPVGRERVEFNAHRVFAPGTIIQSFHKLRLLSFSFVGDDGRLCEDANPMDVSMSHFACGLFEFTKSAA
jgi:hypothetical protein